MTTADELISKAHRFYALALGASNPSMRRRLDRLGDDYLQQAHELKRERTFTEATLLNPDASWEAGGHCKWRRSTLGG